MSFKGYVTKLYLEPSTILVISAAIFKTKLKSDDAPYKSLYNISIT